VNVGAAEVALILWDIAGEDDVRGIRTSYLRGAAGYFLVVDVTRGETLEVSKSIQARVTSEIGSVPFLFLFNKTDLKEQWDIPEQSIEDLKDAGHVVFRTSAKTGEGVEEAFQTLAQRMVL
jgi:small GTP-binding protein